jgi:hypothetical protein
MFKTIGETKWGLDVNEAMKIMLRMSIKDGLEESIFAWFPLSVYGGPYNYLWLDNQIGVFRMWLISDDQDDDDPKPWIKEFQKYLANAGFEITIEYKKVFMYDFNIPGVKYSELPNLIKYRHKFYHELDVTVPIIKQRIDEKYLPGTPEVKKIEEHFTSLAN